MRLRVLASAAALAALTAVGLMLVSSGPARADEVWAEDDGEVDTSTMGKTPAELWRQMEALYINKQWVQCCSRLDRLRELGQSLKGRKEKAGYAYLRCAAIYLRLKNLTATDNALELSRELIGDHADQKPVEAQLHRVLARMALDKEDIPQALAHYELAQAKYRDKREEFEDSVLLAKHARKASDHGNVKDARDALTLALAWYPENREALKLLDALTFWDRSGSLLVGFAVLVILAVLAFTFLRRNTPSPTAGAYDD